MPSNSIHTESEYILALPSFKNKYTSCRELIIQLTNTQIKFDLRMIIGYDKKIKRKTTNHF